MAGLNEGETEATVINNGNISISGSFDISQESGYNFSTNIEEFETEFSNGVPLTLKIDSSSVLALTNINKTVYAAGLYGISNAGNVSLINNGTIFINTDENYNAAGIVAQVAQDGKIFASNMGKIDLSNAKGKITHQFYGRIKDNGQIEIGDWLLDLNDIQNIVPFALAVDENGGGVNKISFAEGASLYLVPKELTGQTSTIELGTLFGRYTQDDQFVADTEYVNGVFDQFATTSYMTDVKVTGADMNHLIATVSVSPEKSLGHQSRYLIMTGDINTLLSLKSLTHQPQHLTQDKEWEITVLPWYIDYRDSSNMGFDSDGGGLVLRASNRFDNLDTTLYLATAKENADSHNQTVRDDIKRYGIGAALRYRFNDFWNIGLRFDAGMGDNELSVSDKFGSDDVNSDSTYLYTEANINLNYPITTEQTLGMNVSVGYLKNHHDGFTIDTLGSGNIHYASDSLDTTVFNTAFNWKGNFDVDGYKILPFVSFDVTYLTAPEFKTSFNYVSNRFVANDEIDDCFADATVGIGFSKDNLSLEVFASQRWGSDLSSRVFNAKFGYKF